MVDREGGILSLQAAVEVKGIPSHLFAGARGNPFLVRMAEVKDIPSHSLLEDYFQMRIVLGGLFFHLLILNCYFDLFVFNAGSTFKKFLIKV